ncbi:uncharacterized protein K452DRAFT_329983 [Aplosporella prunicola CBS 121167]|uniref:WW domain-containing protein n=1 Tax=Aplosporella prunicola CBS 121167 TaxID=1176127 RepID=A0A6A6AVD4_9PEZI|nr:uncharacterized protein K452DRAFT_329983 [Aplosporella prunicola CBS 121167]KAF2135899.1 hypothetical protein K452DRAFT_329983 [Aplosporella prunicola CBS 121167]
MLKSTYKPAPAPPPLPPGWSEHKAPTGHSYYYNAETKQSTYQRPISLPQLFPNQLPPIDPQQPHHHHHHQQRHQQPPQISRGKANYPDRRRHHPDDRPKHVYLIPGCAPWLLVKTKLRRRFVHNPHTNESFWKFPQDVMKGVVEFDRIERERRERRERGEISDDDLNDSEAAAAEMAAQDAKTVPRVVTTSTAEPKAYDSDEYEEVEVTDDEDAENEDGPSKRQKTDEEADEQPVEFNEDDIAYQLAAMGEDYGMDPGSYENGEDDQWEEGAEGLPLTEEDSKALFKDLLDDYHINPFTTWEKVIEEGRVIEDDRYVALPNMRSRKEAWSEWSRERVAQLKEQREKAEKRDPAIPYLAFLQKHATPKLYWPEFRRKYKKEPEMKDAKLLDKDREKWYREHINRLKLPESTRKSDLSALLKSLPLPALNRSTSLAALPPALLTDLRYISLSASVRDSMIEAYISTLPPAPEATGQPSEELEEVERRKRDRERREKALAEREKRVQEEKWRQRKDLEYGKGRLKEEEEELKRAMRVGKGGLKAQLGGGTRSRKKWSDYEFSRDLKHQGCKDRQL